MKRTTLYIVLALIVGLGGGYFLFGGKSSEQENDHNHAMDSDSSQMWTCSMHPQIMQEEPGDCPICGMDLIPAEASADGLAPDQFKMTENAMALANVQTTIVGTTTDGESENMITLSGKITVNAEANTVQASYFDGRIERLNVNYVGQEIGKGQLLATIYSPELVAAQQELLTSASLKSSQPELYQAVRNKLKLWKLSENQINSIESSGRVKENFPIYATVSGTVSELMSATGDYVKKGQPIAKLSNLSSVWAELDAYEGQLSQLKKGQKVMISTNAYPNESFEASISFIDPVLNNATRTVAIRATLNNRNDKFKPGMFVTGKLETDTSSIGNDIINIPSSAVLWTGERSVVYVKAKAEEPIFEMREVMLGRRTGDIYEITSGLESGEEVVTHGAFTVDAAAQLQGKKSMMNKSGGKTMTGHEGHLGIQDDERMSNANEMMKMELPGSFQSYFENVLRSYLALKDSFVASDAKQISNEAKSVLGVLNNLDLSDLGEMEKGHVAKISEMLDIMASKEDLDNQRAHFVILNESFVAIASNLESLNETFYVQQCPMANDNRGAIWLSSEKEIRNPYFGNAMLKCGSVIETLEN